MCTNMDGSSASEGKRNGVTRMIAEAVPHNAVNIVCMAHKLELVMLDALKVSSNIVGIVEECVGFVYRFYYRS